jgi:hypothetical protein
MGIISVLPKGRHPNYGRKGMPDSIEKAKLFFEGGFENKKSSSPGLLFPIDLESQQKMVLPKSLLSEKIIHPFSLGFAGHQKRKGKLFCPLSINKVIFFA